MRRNLAFDSFEWPEGNLYMDPSDSDSEDDDMRATTPEGAMIPPTGLDYTAPDKDNNTVSNQSDVDTSFNGEPIVSDNSPPNADASMTATATSEYVTTNEQEVMFEIGDVVVIGVRNKTYDFGIVEEVDLKHAFGPQVEITYLKVNNKQCLQVLTKKSMPWKDPCPMNCIVKKLHQKCGDVIPKETTLEIKSLIAKIYS